MGSRENGQNVISKHCVRTVYKAYISMDRTVVIRMNRAHDNKHSCYIHLLQPAALRHNGQEKLFLIRDTGMGIRRTGGGINNLTGLLQKQIYDAFSRWTNICIIFFVYHWLSFLRLFYHFVPFTLNVLYSSFWSSHLVRYSNIFFIYWMYNSC